ncbi:DUF5655 domain-containing protein [Patescibacteria group bacterium]
MNIKNKQVAQYLKKQKPPLQEILICLRELILKTVSDCEEKVAWGGLVYAGGKFYLAAMKTRVHLGVAITGLSEAEMGLFEGQGRTMRHLKIRSLAEINKKKSLFYFRW